VSRRLTLRSPGPLALSQQPLKFHYQALRHGCPQAAAKGHLAMGTNGALTIKVKAIHKYNILVHTKTTNSFPPDVYHSWAENMRNVKLRIEAGPRIDAGPRIQASGSTDRSRARLQAGSIIQAGGGGGLVLLNTCVVYWYPRCK